MPESPLIPLDQIRRARAIIGFALTVVAVLVNAVISYWSLQEVAENERSVLHTHRVLNELQATLSLLKDAETGYRGYHITGQENYLEPFEEAQARIPQRIEMLRESVADNPEQKRNMQLLSAQADTILAHLREGISVRRDQGLEPSRDFVRSGAGKQQMDRARIIVNDMEQVERQIMEVRSARAERSHVTAVISILAAAAISLAVVVAASVLAVRELQAQRQAGQILERAHAELETRVRERTAELTQTNQALHRSNRELEQFASVASHDLQEPLRKIQAFGDRLGSKFSEQLGPEGRDYVVRMQASAARLRTLIDSLLSFSRITTRAQAFTGCDLAAIGRDVVSDLESRLEDTHGRVEIDQLPTIQADPLQMRQLLQNLIANALKFHRPDVPPQIDVSARVREPAADDPQSRSGPVCEISVRDNGIGFEEVYLDRIFEVFQRLHGRQEYEGTGMGLAICRKIAERHGGTITARSTPGVGSTFIITLPIYQPNGTAS